MKPYRVIYTYSINVEAEDEEQAEEIADQDFIDISPRLSEFGVMVEEGGE